MPFSEGENRAGRESAERAETVGKLSALRSEETGWAAQAAAACAVLAKKGGRLSAGASADALRLVLSAIETLAAKGYAPEDAADRAAAETAGSALAALEKFTGVKT